MRRLFFIAAFAATLAAIGAAPATSAAQGLAPGTIKLLGKNAMLVDAASGDGYVQITATEPGKFLIVGPVTLQADFKVSLGATEAAGPAAALDILVGGKQLTRFAVTPRAGTDGWKGRTDVKPAASVGFLMEVDPGPHAYEFKVSGADKGAGLFLVAKQKAKKALAANAPVVPAKPAAAAAPGATPRPTGEVARATPAPTPAPVGKSIDTLAATGRRADERIDRYPHQVSLLGGFQLPGDPVFSAGGFTIAEARWAVGEGRTWMVGLEAGAMHYGGLSAIDPRRALPQFAVNVDMTPVIVHGAWFAPIDGVARPYLAAGPGFVYGVSTKTTPSQTIHESKVGPAADVALGVELDFGATDFKEGRQKFLLEARESYANLAFTSHDYKQFSSTAIMAGLAMKF